uniref:hypothetical protein n=1 Tax=Flavobacterium sp. TaxID=239 RepID=UPI00404AF044
MENQKSNSKLKAIIIVLSLLLVASLAYLFKVSTDKNELNISVENLTTEKSNLISELEALKLSYESAMAENTTLSEELAVEREKILDLIKEVEKYKGDVASLQKYKNQYFALESKNKKLIVENERLVRENLLLSQTVDSTINVLDTERSYNKSLVTQNEELAKTVEAGAKLSIVGLNAVAYKVKNSGLEIETEKARVADRLKINFSIAENNIAKKGDRQYYVQVLDPKSNVLGDRQTIEINGKPLTYSFISTVTFEKSTVKVSENLDGKKFEGGTYFVNVYNENQELVAEATFSLR